MRHKPANLILFIEICVTLFLADPSLLQAQSPAEENAPVSATIPAIASDDDTISPTIPILIRPVDAAVTADQKPEFVWRQSTDEDSNFISYTVYIDDRAVFLGVSNDGNSAGYGYTSRIESGEVHLLPTSPLNDGLHSWYVIASDLAGNESSSTRWHFTIDTIAPSLTVLVLDVYQNPEMTENATFDIYGPKNVYFQIRSEPYTSISISFVGESNQTVAPVQGETDGSGLIELYRELELGKYQTQVSGTDPSNLTTVLPAVYLNLIQNIVTIPFPIPEASSVPNASGSPRPPGIEVVIPPFISDIPASIQQLPATISRVAGPVAWGPLLIGATVIAALYLLWLLLRKRHNLILLNASEQPIKIAIIYHYQANTSRQSADPYYLEADNQGRLYVPGLSKGSELKITSDQVTIRLCLLYSRRKYIVVLDIPIK
jgi:hypothetical protein